MKYKHKYFTITEAILAIGIIAMMSSVLGFVLNNCYEMYKHTEADKSLLQQSVFLQKKISKGFQDNPGLLEVTENDVEVLNSNVTADAVKALFDRSKKENSTDPAEVTLENHNIKIEFDASSSDINYREVDYNHSKPGAEDSYRLVSELSKDDFELHAVVSKPVRHVETYGDGELVTFRTQVMMKRKIGSNTYINVQDIEVPLND